MEIFVCVPRRPSLGWIWETFCCNCGGHPSNTGIGCLRIFVFGTRTILLVKIFFYGGVLPKNRYFECVERVIMRNDIPRNLTICLRGFFSFGHVVHGVIFSFTFGLHDRSTCCSFTSLG